MPNRKEAPVNPERKIEFERPKYTMNVRLPLVSFGLLGLFWGKRYLLSMHTDMMGSFVRTLEELKPEIREKLLIQARVLDLKTWRKLSDSDVYTFFYESRYYRGDMQARRETLKLLVPKRINLTDQEIKEYVKLDFTPASLSKEFGFEVGWYKANFLMKRKEDGESFNSLAPYLGAVNQFQIGSNKLGPGILRMVGIRLIQGFEDDTVFVCQSGLANLSDRIIEASSKVVELD